MFVTPNAKRLKETQKENEHAQQKSILMHKGPKGARQKSIIASKGGKKK